MDPDLPVQEMVIRNGQPLWRLTYGPVVVEGPSGVRVARLLQEECLARGLMIPPPGRHAPFPGPDPDGPFGEPGT